MSYVKNQIVITLRRSYHIIGKQRETKMNEGTNMTGYPSIDKPWLKYYAINAPEIAVTYPKNKSLWDIIEDKLARISSLLLQFLSTAFFFHILLNMSLQ